MRRRQGGSGAGPVPPVGRPPRFRPARRKDTGRRAASGRSPAARPPAARPAAPGAARRRPSGTGGRAAVPPAAAGPAAFARGADAKEGTRCASASIAILPPGCRRGTLRATRCCRVCRGWPSAPHAGRALPGTWPARRGQPAVPAPDPVHRAAGGGGAMLDATALLLQARLRAGMPGPVARRSWMPSPGPGCSRRRPSATGQARRRARRGRRWRAQQTSATLPECIRMRPGRPPGRDRWHCGPPCGPMAALMLLPAPLLSARVTAPGRGLTRMI